MLNKVILIGNLGADVEMRYSQSGTAVANLRLATTETWTKDGQKDEHTEWHKVVAFGKLAEIMGEYLAKGSKIYLEGKIQTRKWEDTDGNPRYTTEIVVRDMKMLSPKRESAEQSQSGYESEPPPYPDEDVPF